MSPGSNVDSGTTAVASNGAPTPGTASLRAYLDPETGALAVGVVPGTSDLDPDTQNAVRRDDIGLSSVRHANGSVSMNLDGRFQSVSVIHIDENGNTVVCSDNAAEVERTLSEDVSRPAVLEVK